jgi:tRNA-specific 2-thiouridylase
MSQVRVAVAMSGGVDSSVAAALLKDQGYEVIGFSMQLYDQARNEPAAGTKIFGRCCALDDLHDARRVAAGLGIPHYVINYEKEFERIVVRSFIEAYCRGITPSPCIQCNSRMKFELLARMAEEAGATHIATGHYARIKRDSRTGRFGLWKAADAEKDQSYFLFELTQTQLERVMFPLGGLAKNEVRRLARKFGLDVASKADSQEICFVPDGDYAGFVERYLREQGLQGPAVGKIVDWQGRVLGTHRGIHHYTIGQRRGLGIAHSSPLYVLKILPAENCIVVGEDAMLASRSFSGVRANWIADFDSTQPLRAAVKIRSRHPGAEATLNLKADGSVTVDFDEPQRAVTPGQAAVFYREDEVVGGAWIDSVRQLGIDGEPV